MPKRSGVGDSFYVEGEDTVAAVKWVYDNIHLNRPYNEMVKDMLTANAASNWYVGPASYVARWVVVGLTCEDTVHEDTSDELAINAAKHGKRVAVVEKRSGS